ncbi:class I SAM-dependent methyltransferase [Nocardioides guangzhouensis]|uniref:class I SAM-dependent methyltransferase n=1 Tax=Nocardioides guangzhouensis TaxID=2497878 RepID=UPI001C376D9F|nr:class I SAM-dependent methyltransferase [Nocardioides guangzhouensis]
MSVFYKASYAVGFHPWEDLAAHRPFAEALLALVEQEEDGRPPPYGRALDLGCGSGTWGVKLAARGWSVTGVDNVAKALGRARHRIHEAGVEMRLVQGDVTRLLESDVGPGYDLVLDTGTFHGLTPAQRRDMGREVDAISAADATVVLDCFSPRKRGPLPRGCTREDVEEAFPGWEVVAVVDADTDPDPISRILRFDEVFYRLRRRVDSA